MSPSSRTTSAAHRDRRTNTLARAPHLLHHKLRRAVDRDGRRLAVAIVRDLHVASSKHGFSYQRQVILALGTAHQRNGLTSISRLLPLIVSTAPSFASPLAASMNVCKLWTKDSEQQERQRYWLARGHAAADPTACPYPAESAAFCNVTRERPRLGVGPWAAAARASLVALWLLCKSSTATCCSAWSCQRRRRPLGRCAMT